MCFVVNQSIATIPTKCKNKIANRRTGNRKEIKTLEVMVLDKVMVIRVNALWLSWAQRLAEKAGRTRAELIRDLIFMMIFDDEVGDAIARRLKVEQISFND
jgi:hypothetical protein